MTSNGWQKVSIGEVAPPIQRPETPVPGKEYRQVGVRLWGQGAYEREVLDGAATQYNSLHRVEVGDIIVNKIWARNGSVSVIQKDLSGCYCSSEFPLFHPNSSALSDRWFYWMTKTRWFWAECDMASRGTTSKSRIRPEAFASISIPLPNRKEQDRIVAKLDALSARIDEARECYRQIEQEADALCRSLIHSATSATPVEMSGLVQLRPPDVEVQPDVAYEFAGVYCFGRGVFKGPTKTGMEFSYPRLTRLREGDFVYPKLMAWEGALAVVPPECDGLVVSTEFPVFEIDTNKVLPEVLDVYFRSPEVWPQLSGTSTGTNVRRRRLKPADFLQFRIPLPSRQIQFQLREIKTRMAAMRKDAESIMTELDALLPSALDKAFKGEL
ncbi:MAG: restriction endonuclease subunit S [bacterium]|nr:restriction endonuclease subunit S [bacterium]